MWKFIICVFVGSGVGGACRYLLSKAIDKYVSGLSWAVPLTLFPWATFIVNVAGCFMIGLIYGVVDEDAITVSEQTKALLTAGFCGGLTTFSTFSHENYLLFQSSEFMIVIFYAVMSFMFGLLAAWGGHWVIRWLCA